MSNLQNAKTSDFQQLQVLHGAMMAGAILISTMLGYLLTRDGAVADFPGLTKGFLAIALGLMAVEIVVSNFIWRSRQATIPTNGLPSEKWLHYRTACILRWALLQGGVLISVVLTYLERNTAGFCITAVGLAFLFLARPNRDYVAEQYGLEV